MDVYRALLRKVRSENSLLSVKERKEVFEAFVPKVLAQWDILVEDLLIDCLNRDSSRYAETFGEGFPKHNSSALCEVMLTGIGYLDFKTFGDAKGKAAKVLVDRLNPLQTVATADARRIDQFSTIRNYLAHYSRVSQRAYERMCREEFDMQRVREPCEFLFALVDARRQKTRFEYVFLDAFDRAAMAMAEFVAVSM